MWAQETHRYLYTCYIYNIILFILLIIYIYIILYVLYIDIIYLSYRYHLSYIRTCCQSSVICVYAGAILETEGRIWQLSNINNCCSIAL